MLIEALRRLSPDLVAFQEAIKTDGYDQAADLLGDGCQMVHQTVGRSSDGEGASLASRWPVAQAHEVDLHVTARTADYPCAAVIAEVLVPGPVGPMLFVNHKPSWQPDFERERELQAAAVARSIEEPRAVRDIPVVLAGDLDADPDSASVRFLGRRYQDVWAECHPDDPGHAFSPRNPLVSADSPHEPGRRIDYILVRRGAQGPTLDVRSCRLAFQTPLRGVWASDHFGVTADLGPPGWAKQRGAGG